MYDLIFGKRFFLQIYQILLILSICDYYVIHPVFSKHLLSFKVKHFGKI